MSRLLREPFLHFVLLGVVVFAVDALLRDRSEDLNRGEIIVTAGRIENLAALFARTWQRQPTRDELEALIDGYVLEEALYREGIALGVDQDDSVIKRRVRQKMDFFVDDLVATAEPVEAELEAWLTENAASYMQPARLSFRQIFLNPQERGDALEAEAERLQAALNMGDSIIDPGELGDRSLLPFEYIDATSTAIARDFGPDFVAAASVLPTGSWQGPLSSPYGRHLVFVEAVTRPRMPTLAEVRDQLERDYAYQQREELARNFYREVVAGYEVMIEWPEPAGTAE